MRPFDPLSIDMMHATAAAQPFHRGGWVYEEKYDGWRMLAYKRGLRVRLMSRAGRDHTRRFPRLVAALALLASHTLVLDGEVSIFDQQLVSRFEWLRERPKDETATPPIFMAFDCLWLAGRDLRELDLRPAPTDLLAGVPQISLVENHRATVLPPAPCSFSYPRPSKPHR